MKYKLKKDLPGYSAGTEFEYDTSIGTNWRNLRSGNWVQEPTCKILDKIRENTYWFEPLPEAPTRWKPRGDDKFYFVTYKFGVAEAFSHYSHEQDDLNIFRTKEQAQAVADAIKSLLEYVHLPNDGLNAYNGLNTLFETSKKARKAVQANNQ